MHDLSAPVNLIHHHLSINCWARSWLDASFLVCQREKNKKIAATRSLKMKMASFFMVVTVVTAMLLAEAQVSQAQTCNPGQLSPCLGAIMSSTPPSTTCCSKLKEQEPCLCGYLKDPSLKQFVSSPGATKVARDCGVPYPSC
ncbi:non-specific lipid-transfer protein 2-like [Populus alba x Populus x berolinensis]|nr:non-specific lipid-transfer protein 2-like [Populus alba x Populus x berolinensis]